MTKKIPYDILSVAPLYAALGAVLAGMVFAAVTILLSNPPRNHVASIPTKNELVSTAVFSTLTVFFIFMIASFGFSSIPGHAESFRRIAIIFFFACSCFALAAVMMLVSVTWFFWPTDLVIQ